MITPPRPRPASPLRQCPPATHYTVKFLVAVWLAIFAGCRFDAPDTTIPESERLLSEETWEMQLDRVRRGDSNFINIYESPISPAQFAELTSGCQKLTRLDLTVQPLDDEAFQRVLSELSNLEQVRLTGPINDTQLKTIAKLPKLRVLNLPAATFSDEGLMSLSGHTQLELLRFSSPNVTDDGLRLIRELPSIRHLHVISTPITDAGLKHLYGIQRLESFYVDNVNCTEAGLAELLKELPELHFHINELHIPGDPKTHPHRGEDENPNLESRNPKRGSRGGFAFP